MRLADDVERELATESSSEHEATIASALLSEVLISAIVGSSVCAVGPGILFKAMTTLVLVTAMLPPRPRRSCCICGVVRTHCGFAAAIGTLLRAARTASSGIHRSRVMGLLSEPSPSPCEADSTHKRDIGDEVPNLCPHLVVSPMKRPVGLCALFGVSRKHLVPLVGIIRGDLRCIDIQRLAESLLTIARDPNP